MIWHLLILFVPGGMNKGISRGKVDEDTRIVVHPCDDPNISAEISSQTQLNAYNLLIPIPSWGLDLDLKFDSDIDSLKLIKPGRHVYITAETNRAFNVKFFKEFSSYKLLNCTIFMPINLHTVPYVRSILLNKKSQLCEHPKAEYFDEFLLPGYVRNKNKTALKQKSGLLHVGHIIENQEETTVHRNVHSTVTEKPKTPIKVRNMTAIEKHKILLAIDRYHDSNIYGESENNIMKNKEPANFTLTKIIQEKPEDNFNKPLLPGYALNKNKQTLNHKPDIPNINQLIENQGITAVHENVLPKVTVKPNTPIKVRNMTAIEKQKIFLAIDRYHASLMNGGSEAYFQEEMEEIMPMNMNRKPVKFSLANITEKITDVPAIVFSITTDVQKEDSHKASDDRLIEKIIQNETDAANNVPFKITEAKHDDIENTSVNNAQSQPEAISLSISETCGRKKIAHTALIVHGQSAKSGHWPWHVAIYRIDKLSLTYICGGTLLSKTLVLTAAHCVHSSSSTVVPEAIKVYLGKYNLFEGDADVQEREVFQVIVHHKFDARILHNDIALLKLKYEAVYTDYVQPACLWYKEAIHKLPNGSIFGTVVGWGFNHEEVLSHTLQQITIPLVPEVTCLRSNPTFFHRQLTKNTFCAGFGNGSSVCNGDSGGGLMIFVTETPGGTALGAWHVRGVVSVAITQNNKNVCDPDQYTIFTDVEKYRDWVLGYLN